MGFANLADFNFTDGDDVFEPGTGILHSGSVDFRGGRDRVFGQGTAYGLRNFGHVVLGSGVNSLTGIAPVGFQNESSGSIVGGDDADTVAGSGLINDGFIDLGDGNNSLISNTFFVFVETDVTTEDGFLNRGTVVAGAGDDVLYLTSNRPRSAMTNRGTVALGAGNDRLDMMSLSPIGLDNSGYLEMGRETDEPDRDAIRSNGTRYGVRNTGTIQTGADDDLIYAGAEMDSLDTVGLDNAGTILMGTGDDTLSGSGSGLGIKNERTISLGAGDDQLLGRSVIANSFAGGELAATSLLNEASATVQMGAGNDEVEGSGGLYGVVNHGAFMLGEGDDSLDGSGLSGGVINSGFLDLGRGSDRLLAGGGGGGLENLGVLIAGDGDDVLRGVARIEGIRNTQYLDMGDGNDLLLGVGNFSGVNNSGLIQMGAGDDVVHGSGISAEFSSTNGDFTGDGTIDLGRGNDRLYGWGDQTVRGGAGYDIAFLDGSLDAALNREGSALSTEDANLTLSMGASSERLVLEYISSVNSNVTTRMTLIGFEEVRFADRTMLLG